MKSAMLTMVTATETPAADDMRVTRADDGTWAVTTAADVIPAGGMTNAPAWRWVDRANHEPTSRRESVSELFSRKDVTSLTENTPSAERHSASAGSGNSLLN